MITLLHHPFCPHSRLVRLVLSEGCFHHELFVEPFWKGREEFLDLNPLGEIPVLIDCGVTITDSFAIVDYLSNHPDYRGLRLIPESGNLRTHVLDIYGQSRGYLATKVVSKITSEKYFKQQFGQGRPDPRVTRTALNALTTLLELYTWHLEKNAWLCGPRITLGDCAVAAQLSCVDFFGFIDWERYPIVKDWYTRIKSRPSFQPILKDKIPGYAPVPHYANLDF